MAHAFTFIAANWLALLLAWLLLSCIAGAILSAFFRAAHDHSDRDGDQKRDIHSIHSEACK